LSLFELDSTETEIFSSVKLRHYVDGLISVAGPILSPNPLFSLSHFDVTRPFSLAINGWFNFLGVLSYAPAILSACSDDDITEADFRAKVAQQISLIPSSLITSFNITEFTLHEYAPYPSNAALSDPIGYYTKLDNIQGRRNTFWTGALPSSIPGHHNIIDAAFRLVERLFPTIFNRVQADDADCQSAQADV